MLLNNEGKLEFIKDNFHPYFDITLTSNIVAENVNEFVNFVLPIEKIYNYDLEDENGLKKIFNDDFNNIVFTANDNKTLFKYEVYKKVFFIRMPFYCDVIRMHIIPKKYDASDEKSENPLLFFKADKETITEDNFSCTEQYERKEDRKNINLYYTEETQIDSNGIYKFDIKRYTRNLQKLQINSGYSYNDTNPSDEINHYTGILDESDENGDPVSVFTEFNLALMDANYDNICDFTNTIKAQEINNDETIWPTNTNPYPNASNGFDNSHSINTVYHKTIKYFNDDIYTEEDGSYLTADWDETIIRGV